ncbi:MULTISPECIES: hypothetical protein [Catenuloplanes]|uniref:Tetratricopeptide repeat protein n=1 Tax=Catenuloplanes niger TaxID=587534 RepID=A0AAE3ZM69_9ACTN|nr:hypothetical protein [Catenuloplanes niger]MDR7320430.1 hypothetical protein [Catenuloplanes niger]
MHSYSEARQQAQRIADGGDPAAARALLENVVDRGRPGLATGDPELLTTMRQLAGLYAQAGDHTGARRLLEEAYAAGQQRIQPVDPVMVLLAYDLAVVADELANRLVAKKNFALVAEHGPAALGDGHPAVTHARDYVAAGTPAATEDGFPTTRMSPVPAETPTAPPAPFATPVAGPGYGQPVSGVPGRAVSGVPGYGQPVSGVPGQPVSGAAGYGQPVSGAAGYGQPVSGAAGYGQPVSGVPGQPVSGGPGYGPPVSGSPMFGVPVSGTPVSSSPFGAPGEGRKPHRTPWVIAAAATVFAVLMLVVVLVRPGADPATPVAGPTGEPATTAGTSGTGDAALGALPSPAPSASPAPAGTTAAPPPPAPAATTAAPANPPATTTQIVSPRNGAGVSRDFTVSFAVSGADAAATGTKLALTVCVKEWCFLDGPITIKNGVAEDYTVTLGPKDGEGIGEKWTVRVDRLSQADYTFLADHKRKATEEGTWGAGVTTPIDRLNKTPVSSVVVTKTS